MIAWGDAPAWFAAVGTVGALGASIYLIWNERSLRINQQAKCVAVWAEWKRDGPDPNPRQFSVYIKNSSDSPVFAEITRVGNMPYPVDMGVIPPHDTTDWGLPEDEFPPEGGRPFVVINFRDVNRIRWQCDSAGRLRKAPRRANDAPRPPQVRALSPHLTHREIS
jgi:hypothetical protein